MNEVRVPDKEKIKSDYLNGVKPKDLSEKYKISINTIKSWIKRYGWNKDSAPTEKGAPTKENALTEKGAPTKENAPTEKGAPTKKKTGAPYGNKNAVGNRGGAAPKGNKNAEKHGFYSKWLPEETRAIIEEVQTKNPLDILWDNIQIQYAAIIRAQKLMYVRDQQDKTKEKIGEGAFDNGDSRQWEVQQAWDKHAAFLNAQSRAMKTLEGMISKYDELLHKNWDLATEEQKLRMQKLKGEIKALEEGSLDGDKSVTIIDDIEGGNDGD